MQVIVLKYLQLFCVAVFFDNVNCDQLMLNSSQDDLPLYKTLACTSHCLQHNSNETLKKCYQQCDSQKYIMGQPLNLQSTINSNYKLKFICRDDTSITLQIIDNNPRSNKSSKSDTVTESITINRTKRFNDNIIHNHTESKRLYIIKVQERDDILSQNIVYISNSPLIKIEHLLPNTSYNVFGTVINESEYTLVTENDTLSLKTLERNYMPGNITNIRIGKYLLNKHTNMFDVGIEWDPAKDMSCFYNFYVTPKSGQLSDDLRHQEINKPENLYRHLVQNLTFGGEYAIGISSYNSRRPQQRQSIVYWRLIKVPTCLNWYHNDLNICAPHKPENVVAIPIYISKNIYHINITWNLPPIKPNFYIVNVSDYDNYTKSENISGDSVFCFMKMIHIDYNEYEVSVTAYSNGGFTTEYFYSQFNEIYVRYTEKYENLTIVLYIATPLFIIIMLALIFIFYVNRRGKIKRIRKRVKYFEDLEKIAPCTIFPFDRKHYSNTPNMLNKFNDHMEISKDNLEILEIIGEGSFGFVRKGIILSSGKTVAIKMLKDVTSFEEINCFSREIEVMKSVKSHPNIVGILGHCTQNYFEMMLITEYCNNGNLLNYLRDIWHGFIKKENNYSDRKHVPIHYSDIFKNNNDEYDYSMTEEIDNNMLSYNRKNYLLCNNSCKCHVEIITENRHSSASTCNIMDVENLQRTVKVNDCECKQIKMVDGAIFYGGNVSEKNLTDDDGYARICVKEDGLCHELLSFAHQIAMGMEFLAHNKIVHRDLAARNVLVCDNQIAKLADFGLSRDVYQENLYKKSGNGKLPIKWLALESMTHQIFTSQSDVWSYGILLYEIITLGSTPYPSIQTSLLLNLLKTGYRMNKPVNCGEELYALMLSCWNEVPRKRPTFNEITKNVQQLLCSNNNDLINFNVIIDDDV